MTQDKSYAISKQVVWEAYKKVKANRGAAGVDRQSLDDFEKGLKGNPSCSWRLRPGGSPNAFPLLSCASELPERRLHFQPA